VDSVDATSSSIAHFCLLATTSLDVSAAGVNSSLTGIVLIVEELLFSRNETSSRHCY